jgi:hypothetical protein
LTGGISLIGKPAAGSHRPRWIGFQQLSHIGAVFDIAGECGYCPYNL